MRRAWSKEVSGQMDRVVLDTDFITGILEYGDGDALDLFRRVFRALGCIPVVHSFVADHELALNQKAQILLNEGTLQRIQLDTLDVPEEEDGKVLYRNNFSDMYRQITFETLLEDTDIFARNAGKSFGEIHSILLATEQGIPLLCSNDGDARIAAGYYARGRLTVENAKEVAEQLNGSSLIMPKERKFIGNYYKRRQRGN